MTRISSTVSTQLFPHCRTLYRSSDIACGQQEPANSPNDSHWNFSCVSEQKKSPPISLQRSLWPFKINLILLAVCETIAAATTYTLTATLYDSGYPNVPEDVQTPEDMQTVERTSHTLIYF